MKISSSSKQIIFNNLLNSIYAIRNDTQRLYNLLDKQEVEIYKNGIVNITNNIIKDYKVLNKKNQQIIKNLLKSNLNEFIFTMELLNFKLDKPTKEHLNKIIRGLYE